MAGIERTLGNMTESCFSYAPTKATLLILFEAAKRRLAENSEHTFALPNERIASATEELNRIADDIRDASAGHDPSRTEVLPLGQDVASPAHLMLTKAIADTQSFGAAVAKAGEQLPSGEQQRKAPTNSGPIA